MSAGNGEGKWEKGVDMDMDIDVSRGRSAVSNEVVDVSPLHQFSSSSAWTAICPRHRLMGTAVNRLTHILAKPTALSFTQDPLT